MLRYVILFSAALVLLLCATACQSPGPVAPVLVNDVRAAIADHPELARMFAEDQQDRRPPAGKAIDWQVVGPRDVSRREHVIALYRQGALRTGNDYFHAAMVLQHGGLPEFYLLAHELSVVAIGMGHEEAKWLSAATLDRFLMNIGRPQRFGTQFRSSGPGTPMRLYEVDEGVTDELRREFNVPSIAEAREREALMNAQPAPQPPN